MHVLTVFVYSEFVRSSALAMSLICVLNLKLKQHIAYKQLLLNNKKTTYHLAV